MRLIELEDTPWFPQILRDQQLGYIGWFVQFLDLYKPVVPLIEKQLDNSGVQLIMDLCSGSGEPMASIAKELDSSVAIQLSDLYPPDAPNTPPAIQYIQQPIDTLKTAFNSRTLYTMFNAFHHFDDQQQQQVVQRMKDNDAFFLFVEVLEPSSWVLVKTLIANTLGQLVLAPFVRPFSWTRILLTYIVPINLLTTTYDGIISVLKSKNKKQYQSLLTTYDDSSYCIQINKCKAPHLNSLVIIQGFPLRPLESV